MRRLLKGMDREGNEDHSKQKEHPKQGRRGGRVQWLRGTVSTGASEEGQGAPSPWRLVLRSERSLKAVWGRWRSPWVASWAELDFMRILRQDQMVGWRREERPYTSRRRLILKWSLLPATISTSFISQTLRFFPQSREFFKTRFFSSLLSSSV